KFANNIMLKGKKQTAFQIFYDAIDIIEEKMQGENGIEVWKTALANVTPSLEVKSRRIGGATFQIPTELRPARKQSVGMKNLINFARKRHEKSMAAKLAAEIMAAYKEEGAAFKRKEDTHRMAEANKAFSHFRF
ncbi:MAG: 30S ribosomal protein S7, partial [Bacteroidales bacterium]|nr:30S ribosomal protein S7 [Bacteroidales bacterium]